MSDTISIKPGHGTAGRQPNPELLARQRLQGHDDPGMFGRMFPDLPPLKAPPAALQALADAMKDANSGDAGRQQR